MQLYTARSSKKERTRFLPLRQTPAAFANTPQRQPYWFPKRDRKFYEKCREYTEGNALYGVLLLYRHHKTNTEAAGFSEMPVILYKNTQCHIRAENIIKISEKFLLHLRPYGREELPGLVRSGQRGQFFSGTKSSCRMYGNKIRTSLYILYASCLCHWQTE